MLSLPLTLPLVEIWEQLVCTEHSTQGFLHGDPGLSRVGRGSGSGSYFLLSHPANAHHSRRSSSRRGKLFPPSTKTLKSKGGGVPPTQEKGKTGPWLWSERRGCMLPALESLGLRERPVPCALHD